ncbi:hypothetical protein LMG26411_08188 [Cupriavidus numazuensis]|uniref:Uncharacterized protein n=1 Tax=Cupriavidus numazuensis TaxID=221992 RepID=A0ABM8TX47_9BURK|nr:hypothetical protein LMG26411_08188 [Cupriavidus numazuensis]
MILHYGQNRLLCRFQLFVSVLRNYCLRKIELRVEIDKYYGAFEMEIQMAEYMRRYRRLSNPALHIEYSDYRSFFLLWRF